MTRGARVFWGVRPVASALAAIAVALALLAAPAHAGATFGTAGAALLKDDDYATQGGFQVGIGYEWGDNFIRPWVGAGLHAFRAEFGSLHVTTVLVGVRITPAISNENPLRLYLRLGAGYGTPEDVSDFVLPYGGEAALGVEFGREQRLFVEAATLAAMDGTFLSLRTGFLLR